MQITQIRIFEKEDRRYVFVVLGSDVVRFYTIGENEIQVSLLNLGEAAEDMTQLLGRGYQSDDMTSLPTPDQLGEAPTGPATDPLNDG